jgi:hypothetical protein
MTCVDRPERTSIFRCGDHNGTYSVNWGYAGSVDGSCTKNHLPSCHYCREKRFSSWNAINESSDSNKLSLSNDHYLCCLDSDNNSTSDCNSESSYHNLCSNWDVMNSNFMFPAPKNYPTMYDQSEGAPLPPIGREIFLPLLNEMDCSLISTVDINDNNKRSRKQSTTTSSAPIVLGIAKLSISWLKQAVMFAHHNAKTLIPGRRDRYWTKGSFLAYLRSCSLSSKLCDQIYESAKSEKADIEVPFTWNGNDGFLKSQHYAVMHMLFLGHTKSNYETSSIWLRRYDTKASFGKQVKKYLEKIRRLQLNKYFSAHKLSATNWGTGN